MWRSELKAVERRELKAIEKLDVLEGRMAEAAQDEAVPGAVIVDTGSTDSGVKVRGTLLRHVEAWRDAGAGEFALGVIQEGFKLSLRSTPSAYEEKNNRSFAEYQEFAVEAVLKLLHLDILKEVRRDEVTCINPLTVALNAVGKKRLCIDLSRCVNEVNASYKFRIESTSVPRFGIH